MFLHVTFILIWHCHRYMSQNETAQAEVVRTDEQQERPVVIGTITVVKTDDAIKTEPQDPDYDEARQRSTDGSSTQACAKCKRLKRKLNDKEDELEVNQN